MPKLFVYSTRPLICCLQSSVLSKAYPGCVSAPLRVIDLLRCMSLLQSSLPPPPPPPTPPTCSIAPMLTPSRVLVQALMVLRHFPDTWLDFAAWHTRVGGAKSAPTAIEVLTRAVKVRVKHERAPAADRNNSAQPLCRSGADRWHASGSSPFAVNLYHAPCCESTKPCASGRSQKKHTLLAPVLCLGSMQALLIEWDICRQIAADSCMHGAATLA